MFYVSATQAVIMTTLSEAANVLTFFPQIALIRFMLTCFMFCFFQICTSTTCDDLVLTTTIIDSYCSYAPLLPAIMWWGAGIYLDCHLEPGVDTFSMISQRLFMKGFIGLVIWLAQTPSDIKPPSASLYYLLCILWSRSYFCCIVPLLRQHCWLSHLLY